MSRVEEVVGHICDECNGPAYYRVTLETPRYSTHFGKRVMVRHARYTYRCVECLVALTKGLNKRNRLQVSIEAERWQRKQSRLF